MSLPVCASCRFYSDHDQLCAAPQVASIALMVTGFAAQGTKMDAVHMRLNGSLCGSPGYWYQRHEAQPAASIATSSGEAQDGNSADAGAE